MAEKKLTKREMFEKIKAVEGLTSEMVKFIDHEIELLVKKNASKKLTPKQKANAEVQENILETMEAGKPYTVSELMKAVPALAEMENCSNQYASQMIRALKDAGLVVRSEKGGRAYFTKV